MRFDRVAYHGRVSRWQPHARERLENAALELFVRNGYDRTTVAQIADRAGVNRATFFRHFTDKREVLFGGEDVLAQLFSDAIAVAPAEATLADCLRAALLAAEVAMTAQLRVAAIRRISVVAATRELQERALLKHARIAASVVAALRERGEDELSARFGAEMTVLAFNVAFERWMAANEGDAFSPIAEAVWADLRARVGEFDSPSRAST
jgi:AcrR family transcriptional regulator